MSAVKGVNVTKYDAGAQGDYAINKGLVNANLEVWLDSYEASALASGSTIDVAHLPDGAIVVDTEIAWDALGTSRTLALGDSDDPDRYITAADASSAGSARGARVDGKGYVIGTNDGDNVVQILTAGGTATGTIKSRVVFSR